MGKHFREFGTNGLAVGQKFLGKRALYNAGAHGAVPAGIHGDTKQGARSVVIGDRIYSDDSLPWGLLAYTGAGGKLYSGRHPTKDQVKDQTMTGSNLFMLRSIQTQNEIRVFAKVDKIRGMGVYEFLGMYTAVDVMTVINHEGFVMIKFILVPV